MERIARQLAAPERRPAAAALQRAAVDPASVPIQQRLGNQGAALFVAGSVQRDALTVSSPHDPAEREAVSVASAVMRMPDPAVARDVAPSGGPGVIHRCACGSTGGSCACRSIQREPAGAAGGAAPSVTADIQHSLSGGAPLPDGVRGFMEPRFGADFGGVRIHTDHRAAQLSEGVNANAFTVGHHVFFGRDQFHPESPRGQELIAHELTHTIQQGAAPQAEKVQREEQKSWWERFVDFSEDFIWSMIRRVAPGLEPIIRDGPAGVFEWLKGKITSGVERLFTTVTAPVRAIAGIGDRLAAFFGPIAVTLQNAVAKIAQNDCSPIREAAEKIEQMALRIITPIVEWVQPIIAKVKGFLSDVWDAIGAPVWEWIKQYAADQWQMIKDVAGMIQAAAQWLWDKTATIRSIAERGWTWLKNKIGIGEGVEGQNGILQWVQRKLGEAWDWIKAKLEPFKREILTVTAVVGGILLAVSPAGPILAVGAAVAGAVQGLRWIAAHWGKGNAIVEARTYLEKTLLPQLTHATQQLAERLTSIAGTISSHLGSLANGLVRAVGSLAGSVLSFAVSAIQWIADNAVKLAAWAQRELQQVVRWVSSAAARLRSFIDSVMELLGKIAAVIIDIWGLPLMLAGKVWNWIPACIRDPIVDFIGPIILRQIEIFRELAKDNEAWQKTKADIAGIIKLVFKDHDLMGAVKATFRLVLRVFNVPPELLTTIWQKAQAAWDAVVKKPIDFIKNTVRALGHGFKLLWANKWEHLKYGVQGWLFGELADKKINPPASWTDPKAVFNFVLDVLGLSVDHIFELLAKRFDPAKVAKARLWFGRITSAIEWINKAIDTSKSPAENAKGLVDQAKDFGLSILTGIAEWIAGKVAEEVAILAAAAAASGGLSEIIDIVRRIYKAILTAVRWMRRVLDMVNEALDAVLDLAAGSVAKVGAKFEQIMHRGMPVVIGFLADQVGLGGVGQALRDIVDTLRAKVDQAILWLIDKVKAGIEALIDLVKGAAQAVMDWWAARKGFKTADEEDHELFFEGSGDAAEIMIASKKSPARKFLDDLPDDQKTKPDWITADSVFENSKKIIYGPEAKDTKETDRRKKLVEDELAKIAAAFSRLAPDQPGESDYPKSSKVEPAAGPGKASTNVVEFICDQPLVGSKPREGEDTGTPGWNRVYKAGLTKQSDRWVQMHVVSEKLGGEGVPNNLISAPNSINTGYFRTWEHDVANVVASRDKKAKPVVWVEVQVDWRSGKDSEFADTISAKAGLRLWKGSKAGGTPEKKWEKNTPTLTTEARVPKPDFHEQKLISLNFSSKTDLDRITNDRRLSEIIAQNRTYLSYEQFVDTVTRVAKDKGFGDLKATFVAISKSEGVVLQDVSE